MIVSFRDNETAKLFDGESVRAFSRFERIARIKLEMLHAAVTVQDLKVPPGNRLEKLKGKRFGQYSIRINDQWRVCFAWRDGNAHNVEITDYH